MFGGLKTFLIPSPVVLLAFGFLGVKPGFQKGPTWWVSSYLLE